MTLVVIGATGRKTVMKTEKQKRSFSDDGFEDTVRNTGCEAYYAVDDSFAEKLLGTNLFWSNVDPGKPQILEMINEAGLEPVAVHRSRGTNFGYRESSGFNDICEAVMRKTGADKILHFQTSSNDICRQTYTLKDGHTACRAFGIWYFKRLRDGLAGNASVMIGPEPVIRQKNPGWIAEIRRLGASGFSDDGALDRFLETKTKNAE